MSSARFTLSLQTLAASAPGTTGLDLELGTAYYKKSDYTDSPSGRTADDRGEISGIRPSIISSSPSASAHQKIARGLALSFNFSPAAKPNSRHAPPSACGRGP